MGHIGFGGEFDHFIHAFHMPMFFIVSGMFFEPSYKRFCGTSANPCSSFLKRKAQTLLIPYVCFGSLHYALWALRHWRTVNYLSPLLHLMSVNTYALPYAGALWFLTALFLTEAAYCIIFRCVRSEYIRHAVIILLTLAGHAAYYFCPVTLPFAGGAALVGLGLYHIGAMLRQHSRLFTLSLGKTLALGTVTGALIFLNGYVNVRIGVYGFVPLFYVNVLLSCIVGMSLAEILHRTFQGTLIDGCLQSVGKNSIVYLCLNQIVILAAFKLSGRVFGNAEAHGKLMLLAEHCGVLAVSMVALMFISVIFSRTALKAALGKSSSPRCLKFAVCSALAVLLLTSAGVNFAGHYRLKASYADVHLPDWSRIDTSPLQDKGTLREIIALSTKYLLVTRWNEPHWYAFSQNSNTSAPLGLSAAARRNVLRSAESFRNWRDNDYLYVANTLEECPDVVPGESALRGWAHTCFILSSVLRFNIYEEGITGIPKDDAVKMVCKLTATLARNHCSNSHGGWGRLWQSALWAENIAFAGWLMWNDLSEQDRAFVLNMLVYEADRFIGYEVPYYRDSEGRVISPDDTKAEENAWNSRILALAACMLPEHEHCRLWEAKLAELLLSSTAVPEDTSSERSIDGVKVGDVLHGSNINSDGTVMNHGLYHIDYMTTTIEGMTGTAIIYALAGRKVPESAFFNHDIIYSALVNLDLGTYDSSKAGHHFYGRTEDGMPAPELDMPGVNDWGGKWFTSCYLADTEAEIFGLDKDCPEGLKASDWADVHLKEVMLMVSRNTTGKIFGEGENYFVSGETYAMQNLCKAYLLRVYNRQRKED
ncbi:MAG: acyltransferase [Synergistaceae bacterium]|nr:acyltransferase [Synergistaceae bacterium]